MSNLVVIVDVNGRPIGQPVRVAAAVGAALVKAGKARAESISRGIVRPKKPVRKPTKPTRNAPSKP